MKNKILLVAILALFLMAIITGCSKSTETNEDDNEKSATDIGDKISQEAVNFKCVIANVQTIYFLKGDAKIESDGRESWLIGDKYYMKMDIGGTDYLIEYPAAESEMTSEDMVDTYKTSKAVPNLDCQIGVVKESDLALPDLEILDSEEFQQKLTEEMMAQYS